MTSQGLVVVELTIVGSPFRDVRFTTWCVRGSVQRFSVMAEDDFDKVDVRATATFAESKVPNMATSFEVEDLTTLLTCR